MPKCFFCLIRHPSSLNRVNDWQTISMCKKFIILNAIQINHSLFLMLLWHRNQVFVDFIKVFFLYLTYRKKKIAFSKYTTKSKKILSASKCWFSIWKPNRLNRIMWMLNRLMYQKKTLFESEKICFFKILENSHFWTATTDQEVKRILWMLEAQD